MAKISVKKSHLSGEISCPPSKSYSHRAIVVSPLTNGESNLQNVLLSRDTIATINCCKMLGVAIESEHFTPKEQQSPYSAEQALPNAVRNVKISSKGGRPGFITPGDILNAENSGTTIRLLASMCSLVNNGFTILTGDKSLRKRPMGDLIKSLNQLGVECFSSNINNTPPLIVKGGGMEGGEAIINGQISSQFISSLLLTCIYAKTKTIIKVSGNQVSKPYINSTISIMKKFGIEIENNHYKTDIEKSLSEPICIKDNAYSNGVKMSEINKPITESYTIPNEKDYSPTTFRVPGDFSSAALLISSAIMSDGELTIDNLDFSLPQGDSNIINIVKDMGADIVVDKSNGKIKVIGTNLLEGGGFDLKDTPDLLPVVSILSLKCKNPTKITGISHARYKETDRVANIANQLKKFGAEIKEEFDSIAINPPKEIKNASINSFEDHRLFMAFCIASLMTEKSEIDGAEFADVSYPGFVGEMKRLGASIV
jgi:3-phosphoshikimate 1-carboxyvinyltransferase